MKRILVTIVGQGSIMYLIRSGLIDKLQKFCCPVIVLLWQQDDLIEELHAKGFETYIIPEYGVSPEYIRLRHKIDIWYKYYKLKTPSTDIALQLHNSYRPKKMVLKRRIKDLLLKLKFSINSNFINRLLAEEKSIMAQQPCYNAYKDWVTALKADGLITVTPFLQQVELIGRLLKDDDKINVAAIHSFDNITKRGWPAVFFDEYLVWNKYNKAELTRINSALAESNKIAITGAPQFDAHYNQDFCWDKNTWLQKLSLPVGKKIILYAGGSENLFPDEPQYLLHLADAVAEGLLGSNVVILFRCHPLDQAQRWKEKAGERDYIFYDSKPAVQEKIDYNNFTHEDTIRLVSTLKHADVHVSICSTMTVDGAVFNKPIIGPYYDDAAKHNETALRNIYHQEHYKPIMQTGVVNLAQSRNELINKVQHALINPAAFITHSLECVEEIITFTDGLSSQRVADKVQNIFA